MFLDGTQVGQALVDLSTKTTFITGLGGNGGSSKTTFITGLGGNGGSSKSQRSMAQMAFFQSSLSGLEINTIKGEVTPDRKKREREESGESGESSGD